MSSSESNPFRAEHAVLGWGLKDVKWEVKLCATNAIPCIPYFYPFFSFCPHSLLSHCNVGTWILDKVMSKWIKCKAWMLLQQHSLHQSHNIIKIKIKKNTFTHWKIVVKIQTFPQNEKCIPQALMVIPYI